MPRVGVRVESGTAVFSGDRVLPIHSVRTLLLQDVSFSHNAQRHRQTQTDRQTDGQTDDIMTPIDRWLKRERKGRKSTRSHKQVIFQQYVEQTRWRLWSMSKKLASLQRSNDNFLFNISQVSDLRRLKKITVTTVLLLLRSLKSVATLL